MATGTVTGRMATNGQTHQTGAREAELRERCERKQAKKDARKQAAAAPLTNPGEAPAAEGR